MKKLCLLLSSSIAMSVQAAEMLPTDSVPDSTGIHKEVLLKEVAVKAQARVLSVKNGDFVMRVAGTSMAQETSSLDVLSKMPGLLKDQDGNLVSYKGNAPVYYVNGKEVYDFSVIENLPVGSIKDVKLITNPGAKYSAGTGCVVEIRTRRNNQYFAAQLDNEYDRNHYNSNSHSLFLQHAGKKVVLEGLAGYDDYRNYSVENVNLTNMAEPTYENRISTHSLYDSDKRYKYQFSTVFPFSDTFEVGIQYDGWKKSDRYRNAMADSSFVSSFFSEDVYSLSRIKDGGHMNHVNAYGYLQIGEKWELNAYGDWVNSRLTRSQEVAETSVSAPDIHVSVDGHSDYNIYAGKLTLDYAPAEDKTVSVGVDYAHTHGKSLFEYTDDVSNSDYVTTEKKFAAFAEYQGSSGKLSYSAGFRFEHVGEEQNDRLHPDKSTGRTYDNLFPSLSLTYSPTEGVHHSLKYRSGIRRPDFSWMSTSSTYVNRFMRQVGSPTLKPQISHQIDYSYMHGNFFVQAGYTYNHDYLGINLYKNENHPEIVMSSWKNYNKEQDLSILTGYRYRLGPFEPTWSVGMRQHFLTLQYLGEDKKMDKPFWFLKMNNIIRLPWKIRFNLDWSYMSSGEQVFVKTKPISVLNVGFQRKFLADRLTITLQGDDIFKGGAAQLNGGIGDIHLGQYIYRDQRAFSIHLTWKINKAKSKYSSESAAQSEINRLNQ